ncbi:MAG: TetR/AcrR family transcriptional regulator [Pseudomonadales bacterium]|nr:TetR/AcrR family transcriptional regulator [Pseudomonadales bacterium]
MPATPTTKTSAGQKKPSRKTEILQAAADLFAQLGFDGSSINAIANRAGVKKSLIQYHFDSKDLLWQATVTMVWQQRNDALPRYLDEAFIQRITENDQQYMVRDLCKRLLQFSFDQPQWVRLMFQEASTPGPRLDWMVEEFFREDFANGKAMIELAQERELLPRVDAMNLLHILSGALIYLVNVAPITAKVTGEDPNSEEYMDRHIDTLMAILSPQLR